MLQPPTIRGDVRRDPRQHAGSVERGQRPTPEEASKLVEQIAARSAMLSQQILDMLQLSNLHSQSQDTLCPARLDLAEVLRGLCIARVEPAAGLRGISIAAELEPVSVTAVEDHLRMLFGKTSSQMPSTIRMTVAT